MQRKSKGEKETHNYLAAFDTADLAYDSTYGAKGDIFTSFIGSPLGPRPVYL